MSSNFKIFFVILIVNFLVLGCLNIVFEYFDTGDDPLYSYKVAFQNLFVSLLVASFMVWQSYKKSGSSDQKST